MNRIVLNDIFLTPKLMVAPHTVRWLLALVVIAAVGFLIGYGAVTYYKKTHLSPVQEEAAPELPS